MMTGGIAEFIEKCVFVLEQDSGVALCRVEVQYETTEGIFPFFAQGIPFYKFVSADPLSRTEHLLRYNYDNLIYCISAMPLFETGEQ